MKLIECPICDSKYDIEKVPDGTKLKCARCKKVFGMVQDGDLVPILEKEVVTAAPPPKPVKKPLPPPEEEPYAEEEVAEEYEEVPARPVMSRPRTQVPSRLVRRRDAYYYEEPVEKKKAPKPDLLLVIGGLVGLVGIGTLIYVWHTINQPFR